MRIKTGAAVAAIVALIAAALTLGACAHIDDERIPYSPVRIPFQTVGEWDVYGVSGAYTHRRFIRADKVPANFPYTALTYTGYGGVLLVGDVLGTPKAYDLACPVEVTYNIRVAIDPETHYARCPVCHSEYDVFMNYGAPVSGPAAEKGYGLRRYAVGAGATGEYMLVMNAR